MNIDSLKTYLNKRYQGSYSFLENIIFPIFGEDNFEDESEAELLDNQPEWKPLAETTGIRSIKHVGKIYVGVELLQIFDITVSDRVMMERNRVNIQKLVRAVMADYSCAFMLFHYGDDSRWDWRFTYCRKSGSKEESTDSKRFTFLLGPGQSCRTAAENFCNLYEKRESLEFENIESAFNVEALSNKFFSEYRGKYDKFVEFITGKRYLKKGNKYVETKIHEPHPTLYSSFKNNDKLVRDYVKKMLGRIVFLHFLQKKGWLGVPAGGQWGEGDLNFMLNLFKNATEKQKENFLDEVLEGLFANGLDRKRSEKKDLYDTKVEGFRDCRIPYLNGGLFERDRLDELTVRFPAEYFDSLFTMLSQYNFTIDENDPYDAEVGVDPEMLGRIFENLLEDNKDKGAFYTPKEIVQYMCRESLIAYLQTDQKEEDKERIRLFVTSHDGELLGDLKADIDEKLRDVKICDPAIGSGAFPMGLLRELFFCRSAIEPNIVEHAADIKRHIIQNNIYGVDIERGAVDIARLRFWLALIVDEKSPEALPNLDFKIMQGNSLLESYEGIDLSKLAVMSNMQIYSPQSNLFGELEEEQTNIVYTQTKELKDFQDNLKHYFETTAHEERTNLRKAIEDYVRYTISYTLDTHKHGEERKIEQIQLSTKLTDKQSKAIAVAEENINHLKEAIENVQKMELPNSQFFLWHTWFHDVFSHPSKEGFDIVIGNPPYIQLQNNNGELAKLYKEGDFSTFASTGDIYCLFYECGWRLLKENGHLCYITSNKWMRAGYGEKTREFFANKTNPMLLIDFAGVKIFESATVDTNILLFAKSNNLHKTVCAVINKQNKESIKNLSDFVRQQDTICDFSTSDSWVILSPIEQSIKKKIEAVGTPLKDWDIQINYGIKTGCNEAFIISPEKRKEILDNCQTEDERKRTAELIRPILRGRDIKRYGYEWAELWLIATFPSRHYNIDEYPAIKQYLLSFGIERLEQTGKTHIVNGEKVKARKRTSNKWFETQDSISYWEDFSKPKIIWKIIGSRLAFAIDNNGIMLNNACYLLTGNHLAHILGFLNSSPLIWYSEITNMNKTGVGDAQVGAQNIILFPIPSTINEEVVEIVEQLLSTPANSNLKRILSERIYAIYGLDIEEISYLESLNL